MSNFFFYKQNNFDSQLHPQQQLFKNTSHNRAHFRVPDSALIHRITALEINDEFDPYAFSACTNHLLFKKYDFSKSAPESNQWLHGKINRFQAEERLKTFGQPGKRFPTIIKLLIVIKYIFNIFNCMKIAGCYLVRESDRIQPTFVLSYLDNKGSINHFQIKAICGDYYIAGNKKTINFFKAKIDDLIFCLLIKKGEKFQSLKHLIGYYTKYCDLLKNEKLVYPVPPIEKSFKEKPKFVAIVPYDKMPETDELSFCKGDLFEVHSCQDDWLWATNLRTNESGLVYIRTVKELVMF